MNLSKREKYIAAAAVAVLALLVADRAVITPVLRSGEALEAERLRLVQETENNSRLFRRRQLMARKWEELTTGGLTPSAPDAESQLLHAVRNWAAESGLALSSVKPERSEKDGRLRQITVMVSGTGGMRSAARFLWLMETTDLPLRVHELQLGARREGADDLSLQVRASTLYLGYSETGETETASARTTGGAS